MKISQIRKLSQKSTKEPIFILILRELSYPIVKFCLKTSITPNAVSILNIMVAFITPVFFLYDQYVVGIIFLFLWKILDCVDGEIARIKKQFSIHGGFLDYIGDKILPPLLFIAIGINQNILLLSLLPAFLYVVVYYSIMLDIRPKKNMFIEFAGSLNLPIYMIFVYIGLFSYGYTAHLFFIIMSLLYLSIFNTKLLSINLVKERMKKLIEVNWRK